MPNVKLVQYLKEFEMRPTPVATENGVVMDPNYPTLYQDGHPYHLVSLDTIDSFNRFLPSDKKKVTQANFRANIVTEGSAENDEDRWEFIRMKDRRDGGVVKFKNVKLCTRCVIPTIDQEKGEKDNDLVDIYKRLGFMMHDMHDKTCRKMLLLHLHSFLCIIYYQLFRLTLMSIYLSPLFLSSLLSFVHLLSSFWLLLLF